MQSNLHWLLLSVVVLLGFAFVAQAETQARDGTPAVVKADGKVVAGLFRRIFDGKRCPGGQCPVPDEPDVPDDPPPVEDKPVETEPEPGKKLPALAYVLAVGGTIVVALFAYFRKGGSR
jgi:hypothetical protein